MVLVRTFVDAHAFSERAAPALAADPLSTNVISVVLSGPRDDSHDDLWVALVEGDQIIGVAMHTPPHAVFVGRMPRGAVVALVDHLVRSHRPIVGVNGEAATAALFADTWFARTGDTMPVVVATRAYRLGDLRPPEGVPGAPRLATAADDDLVVRWFHEFHSEARPEVPSVGLGVRARARIRSGQLALWTDDGAPVSVAGFTDPVHGVSRVQPVYSPPDRRRRGYGSAVTAYVSELALAKGAEHVMLYADLSNPTSNAIYQQVGYVPDHDGQERRLVLHG